MDLGSSDMALDMSVDMAVDMRAGEDMPVDMPGGDGPREGFGAISGDCRVLDDELTDMNSHFFVNAIDFAMDPWEMSDEALLTMGGQRILMEGNAGGSSLLSEIFAFEVLARCEDATLLKTEEDLRMTSFPSGYMGTITDLIVRIDGEVIGVSVVRALAFPFDDPYPLNEATRILIDKFEGINESTANVKPEQAWTKQVLSVMAYTPQHADQIRTAYNQLDAALIQDTVLVVTVTNGDDGFIYGR